VETSHSGDELARMLATLANPHRMRVIAALASGRNYVSALARELGISRPLLQLHLARLEAAGLVTATFELSADGKAMKFYDTVPFTVTLTPQSIALAARTLTLEDGEKTS
jgi:predicted transcriptional regulator